jgi:L-lactate utilization protein LutC
VGVAELWELFESRVSALGGRVATPRDLTELQGRRVVADADAEMHLHGLGIELADDIWEAEAGVTMAELAVAESGSLLLASGPGRQRLASLAPEIHVCLVPSDAIVKTLEEALPHLTERNGVLITGSSRTADIEGVLVRGVHGPKEVWIVPLGLPPEAGPPSENA